VKAGIDAGVTSITGGPYVSLFAALPMTALLIAAIPQTEAANPAAPAAPEEAEEAEEPAAVTPDVSGVAEQRRDLVLGVRWLEALEPERALAALESAAKGGPYALTITSASPAPSSATRKAPSERSTGCSPSRQDTRSPTPRPRARRCSSSARSTSVASSAASSCTSRPRPS